MRDDGSFGACVRFAYFRRIDVSIHVHVHSVLVENGQNEENAHPWVFADRRCAYGTCTARGAEAWVARARFPRGHGL